MKKTTLVIAAMLYAFSSFSQKCDYLINKKDEFTGKFSKTTQVYLQGSVLTGGSSFLFSQSDTTYSVAFLMMASMFTTDQTKIKEGSTSFFKFTDGEILKVKNSVGGNNSTYNTFTGGNTIMYLGFVFDRELLKKLSQKPIEKIRIGFNEDGSAGYDMDLNKSKQQKMQTAVNCILN